MANEPSENGFMAPTWDAYKASFSVEWRELAYVLWPWWVLLQFGDWYSRTFLAKSLRVFEPLGIALAVVALGFTWVELHDAKQDRKIAHIERIREQALRETTLYAMASERLDAAREADNERGARFPTAQKGQKRALEAMVEIGASISGIDASMTNLAGANLRKANLRYADLSGADLSDARLLDAGLRGARLFGATLTGSNLFGADLIFADLRGADLGYANIGDADLEGADLRGAVLGGANLRDAKLDGANLTSAGLDGTILFGADLRGAKLRRARNLTQAQLDEACGNRFTTLDEGLTIKRCEE